MGIYLTQDSHGNPLPENGKADALIKDGAEELHVVIQHKLFLVCCFYPSVEDRDVAAFVYSREEFLRFAFNPFGRNVRWLIYPPVENMFGKDTIRLHKLDYTGPKTFNQIDREEEMEALHKSLSKEK